MIWKKNTKHFWYNSFLLVIILPGKHNDDDGVGDECDAHEDRHDEAIDGLDKVERTKPGAGIDNVATSELQASR